MKKLAFITILLLCKSTLFGCSQTITSGRTESGLDTKPLYQIMLEWAVLDKLLPDRDRDFHFLEHDLIKDLPVIRISKENLPSDLKILLAGKKVEILEKDQLRKIAESSGDFPALRFTQLKTSDKSAELGISLIWITKSDSKQLHLSGGSVKIRFLWKDGAWRFEDIVEEVIS